MSLCVLNTSKNVATINQGDFFLAFDSLLEKTPVDVVPYSGFSQAAFIWSHSVSNAKPLVDRNLSWVYLWLQTKLQGLFSEWFDLFFMALISKLIILACFCRLGVLSVSRLGLSSALQTPVFLLFVVALSFAHNIAFLNSFYGEHTLFVFLPVVLVGFFEKTRWISMLLISVGLLFCGGAKPQYFYLPGLAAAVMTLIWLIRRQKIDPAIVILLVVEFALSWYYAFNASGNPANFYNSTYFGSYLMLSDSQLKDLGVRQEDLECVGVDPWGNRIDRHDTLKLSSGPQGCTQRIPITLGTVLAPYLSHPSLLVQMWQWVAPAHFTVNYFHVYPETKYIIPADGKAFHGGGTLVWASRLRERFITPHYWAVIILGLLLPFVNFSLRVGTEIRIATLVLAVFIPTQFAVSILGEGVRDLSKHLAGAQYCLDLLCVLLILQFFVYASELARLLTSRTKSM